MTTQEEYEQMQESLARDMLFLLAYARGCEIELGMGTVDSFKESFRILFKKNKGFVEPYKINVTKYQRQIEKEHPELDKHGIKFTGEVIVEGNTTIYPFEITQ